MVRECPSVDPGSLGLGTHPGTQFLYNTNLPVMEGGGTLRARFGVERNGVNLLAEGSYSVGSEIEDGYPNSSWSC
jgi:formate dehydrogenase major subunit